MDTSEVIRDVFKKRIKELENIGFIIIYADTSGNIIMTHVEDDKNEKY